MKQFERRLYSKLIQYTKVCEIRTQKIVLNEIYYVKFRN
jgi:hypothetical protein